MTTKEIKLMIIENFIDHSAIDATEADRMKSYAQTYIDNDHVDEIAQAGFVKKPTEIENQVRAALQYGGFIDAENSDETTNSIERGVEVINILKSMEDKSQLVDFLDEGLFQVSQAFELSFTVESFLDHIGA